MNTDTFGCARHQGEPHGVVTDLLLLHAPSVYDFRRHSILYGPVSDMVPSSTVFEMYPIGFLTIASYLHDRGYDVRIVNLALRMMNDADFDVPTFLGGVCPRAIGIDLHWLPHAHGALEVARICKERHPDVPVIMGGLSASYFHEELIRYPQVDFVLRGDSTEPPLLQLLRALRGDGALADVPNLTWKQGVDVRVNPHDFVPESLDYVDLRPDVVAQMIVRHRDVGGALPMQGWLRNPMTAMLTVKGCSHDCVTCGASRTTCTSLIRRRRRCFVRLQASSPTWRRSRGFPAHRSTWWATCCRPGAMPRRKCSSGCIGHDCQTRSCSSSSTCRMKVSCARSIGTCGAGASKSARTATIGCCARRRTASRPMTMRAWRLCSRRRCGDIAAGSTRSS
ncbi:MAG TPA: cobalamin-dependent protein [Steroidobacteraceae bacterium]|nr:cobalamin-dependent protein [Steroidobacteraceae bacterium]